MYTLNLTEVVDIITNAYLKALNDSDIDTEEFKENLCVYIQETIRSLDWKSELKNQPK